MLIFRRIVIAVLILWLTFPLSLVAPDPVEQKPTDSFTVSVLLPKQNTQKFSSIFWQKINGKVNNIQSIKPTLSRQGLGLNDLLKIEQYFQVTLFYFWQGLIKPTRQLLWQMTSKMQRSLMKKMAGGYPKNKFIVYFDNLSYKIESVLDKEVS